MVLEGIKRGGGEMRINTRDMEGKPLKNDMAEFKRAMRKVWLSDEKMPAQKVSLREV